MMTKAQHARRSFLDLAIELTEQAEIALLNAHMMENGTKEEALRGRLSLVRRDMDDMRSTLRAAYWQAQKAAEIKAINAELDELRNQGSTAGFLTEKEEQRVNELIEALARRRMGS